ncbi:N-acetylmuramoyl-L-alanine amidase [Fulvimarina sp. 2208YS6-2-32]|uniref:peptidoglycan recognition protein family protein n=1 Tax=Fulvimarina uroteuthidis TaxID=3098149 RepID=UPI003A101D9D
MCDPALDCEVRPSPNVNERRGGLTPDILLLHYTGMGTGDQALDWLCNRESGVSCHYLVHEDGRIVQMVPEAMRAWHAGVGSWRGRNDINSTSIGIEIVNGGHSGGLPAFPERQIDAVVALSRDILGRHAIRPEFVLAHSDIAPDRKEDPGEHFPWDELHRAGIGHLVAPAPMRGGRYLSRGDRGEPVSAFQAMLSAYGYGLAIDGDFDEATRLATIAFQRHFRPARVDGVADISTIDTLHRLLAALERSPFADRTPSA